jgi:4-amino-4-deoxy-L-arabinose transferase-like glycosyltransferase
LYLWGITASGYANTYYAAAVQAGTQNWTALLFGSLDAGNAITVDKPPASLWVMALSGRLLGFSSWSMLAPQAILGVLTVALLYAAVRRWSGHRAGLLAGALFALTPVATLMFRFNNPDALLTLLLVASGYALVRALENASPRWLALVGVAIGFAFLTKMMQAFVIVPVLALVYLVAAPTSLRRRLVHLVVAAGALIASAGWWVVLVMLTPTGTRPYIGGTADNSIWELIISGNGLDRLLGNTARNAAAPGGGGSGGANVAFGGPTGWARMFEESFGTQVSWLLPAALIGLVVGLWLRGRAPRTDRIRAALLLWGGWMLITGAVFSFMSGVVHPYYSVALAPAITAVLAVSVRELWRRRERTDARVVLAAMVTVTGVWGWVLLGRAESWHPELRWIMIAATVIAVTGVLMATTGRTRTPRMAAAVAVVAAVAVATVPSAAYSLQTASTGHSGSIPTAGPSGSGGDGMTARGAGSAGGPPGYGPGGYGPGGYGPEFPGDDTVAGRSPSGDGSYRMPSDPQRGGPGGGNPGDNGVGMADTEIVELLQGTDTTWSAAVVGAQTAAPLELSSGTAVIAIGGFSGGDNGPTLNTFQQWVAAGEVSYFLTAGSQENSSGGAPGGGAPGGERAGSAITDWVQENYSSTSVGSWTVYELTTTRS